MENHSRTLFVFRPVLMSLVILVTFAISARGQQTGNPGEEPQPSLAVAPKPLTLPKSAPTPAIELPDEPRSIWREPAWYVSIGGAAFDMAVSAAVVDGRGASEGNPLFARSDGKVAWERALPFTAASLALQYKLYKNPKNRKWAIFSMFATGIMRGTLGGARGLAMR